MPEACSILPRDLSPQLAPSRLHHVAETPSTNDLALASRVDGAVFLADAQSAGRGRQGGAWASAPGLGLWCSMAVEGLSRGLSMVAALAVRDALAPTVSAQVKWPNDLLLNGRKCCGILIEHRQGWNAVGIGLNLYHDANDFPESLRETAISVQQATGLHLDRMEVLGRVVAALDHWRDLLQAPNGQDRVRETWAEACDIVGKRVVRGAVAGTVKALDGEGALLVETTEGLRRIDNGAIDFPAEGDSCCS